MAHEQPYFIVEHMEDGISDWVEKEYLEINRITNGKFILSSVPSDFVCPASFSLAKIEVTSNEILTLPGFDASKVCLLDPNADKELTPEDSQFKWFLFGGILGDEPPRDRTRELRRYNFAGRHLGPEQMTTDTAIHVTKIVVEDRKKLSEIAYVDYPEFQYSRHESTQMPFRYIKGEDGEPIMPEGMRELIRKDAEKCLDL